MKTNITQPSEQLQSTKLIALPYTFISIQGTDAEKFLQGQVSCDLSKLNSNRFTYGTANTPKGRMYSLFKIAIWKEGYLLRLHNSISEQTFETLSKYKVFFKCTMALEEEFKAYGLLAFGLDSLPIFSKYPEAFYALHRSEDQILSRCATEQIMLELWSNTRSEVEASSEPQLVNEWFALETQNGIPELYSQTSDAFILQYLNLQELDAVSFNKGCYTGQEIIARMKFLGKLKKKCFLIKGSSQAKNPSKTKADPGSALFNAQGKKCGDLVRIHPLPNGDQIGLAILKVDFADKTEPVFLSKALDITFEVAALNYNTAD